MKPNADSHQQLLEWIHEAESHLGVPNGTLGDLAADSDFLLVMKVWSTIEPILIRLMESHVGNALSFDRHGAIAKYLSRVGNIDQRRQLLFSAGVINEYENEFIRAIYYLRNRYAHNIATFHLSISELAENLEDSHRALVRRRIGIDDGDNDFMRFGIFLELAHFLGRALVHLRPPPPLPEEFRGWAGTIFAGEP